MRARDWAWWRPVLGLLLFSFLYVVAAFVVVILAYVTGVAPDLALLDLIDPAVLLITNASLIVAIPIVWLCWVVAHGLRIGWSSSVVGRLRWRLLPALTWRALVTLGVGIVLSIGLSVLLLDEEVTGPEPTFVWLLLVVLLTTPLQSAAEEYVFRGYLSQAIAGWIRAPRAGAIVAAVSTAAVFSLAHAPPDLATFWDRFVFGLAASAVVWLTGGLEAAIVLHAVNNVVVFLLAGSLGDAVATAEVPDQSLWTTLLSALLTMAMMSAYVFLVWRWRSRARPELFSGALDLRGGPPPLPGGVPPIAGSPPLQPGRVPVGGVPWAVPTGWGPIDPTGGDPRDWSRPEASPTG
jgi:hypothetical protein